MPFKMRQRWDDTRTPVVVTHTYARNVAHHSCDIASLTCAGERQLARSPKPLRLVTRHAFVGLVALHGMAHLASSCFATRTFFIMQQPMSAARCSGAGHNARHCRAFEAALSCVIQGVARNRLTRHPSGRLCLCFLPAFGSKLCTTVRLKYGV